MNLTDEQKEMLAGVQGPAVQKAMQILAALGKIYGAERMVPVASVQIAGVSYDNLGEAGLGFLDSMADGGGKVRVPTTLNPAGMDVENWQALGISPEFAENQSRVIAAFTRMGAIPTCSCTPYLFGHKPGFGEHIAWAESSAVCFANSVLGARTNREGGPSALSAALTGFTPEYGLHLEENRIPVLRIDVSASPGTTAGFGALGASIGRLMESAGDRPVAYICGIIQATTEQLKSFCASVATFGGAALFHMEGITPEADKYSYPERVVSIGQQDIDDAFHSLTNAEASEVDFISLGCPHLSIDEIAHLADLMEGRRVKKEFWITTARPTKQLADRLGYSAKIEASGAKFAADTCCVVSPIKGRFNALATDSAKACYYARAKNQFKTLFCSFDEAVRVAVE